MIRNIFIIFLAVPIFCSNKSPKPVFFCDEFISNFPDYSCAKNKNIGMGSNGSAFLIKDKSGKKFILKRQKTSNKSKAEIETLLSLVDRPYIISLKDYKETATTTLMIITYGSNGNLLDFSLNNQDKFDDPAFVVPFFAKILQGLMEINDAGFVHSDMKLENVVVDENLDPIIIDFDLAIPLDSVGSGRGTKSYMAPEVMFNFAKGLKMKYTGEEDIYSFGVMLYMAVFHKRPIKLQDPNFSKMIKSDISFPASTNLQIYKIISDCLKVKTVRISAQELARELQPSRATDKILGSTVVFQLRDSISSSVRTVTNSRMPKQNSTLLDSEELEEKMNPVLLVCLIVLALLFAGFAVIACTFWCRKSSQELADLGTTGDSTDSNFTELSLGDSVNQRLPA